MRYQIKVLDADLTNMVHELTAAAVAQVMAASAGQVRDMKLYPVVFDACKRVLQGCVRGFHVCGCSRHCDEEAQATPLADPSMPSQDLKGVGPRSPRIQRYVLSIDVPLKDFVHGLEVEILHAVADGCDVANWRGGLFPAIRKGVEPVLGRYLFFTPRCNRGEYACEAGACTEFDPWVRVRPKEAPA